MTVKIITEPAVHLVGMSSMPDNSMSSEAFFEGIGVPGWHTNANSDPECLVEVAGRLCYMSFASPRPGGNHAYIKHLLEVGHGSVLEHAVFSLIIEGVSRSFTHELVRHRAGFAYSQLSQRYVDESDVAFVVPPAIAIKPGTIKSGDKITGWSSYKKSDFESESDHLAMDEWVNGVQMARRSYQDLHFALSKKYANIQDKTARTKMVREAARSVLPNCTETKIFVTANARALRHFIEMRANPSADAEMRRVAVAVLNTVKEAAPNLFGDYTVEPCTLGGESATTVYKKV